MHVHVLEPVPTRTQVTALHAYAHAPHLLMCICTCMPPGLWESTLLIFVSDNGGPTNGNEGTASNNFPMRGGKNTLWEGGTRVVAVARGAGVGAALRGTVSHAPVNPNPDPNPHPHPHPNPNQVSHAPVHAVDWLRTLHHFATAGQARAPPLPP